MNKTFEIAKKRYNMPEGHPARWGKDRIFSLVPVALTPEDYKKITGEEWIDLNPPVESPGTEVNPLA